MDAVTVPDGQLIPIQSPHSNHDGAFVDIVAIHGLGTTSPDTWQATASALDGQASRQVNWLSDENMLPAVISNSNIYYFSWNSHYYENGPVVRIPDVAEVLLGELRRLRGEGDSHSNPLIFIASCFGGLIITKALEIATVHGSPYRPLLLSTAGVVFLGSPLQGTRAATAAQWQAMLGGILNKNPSQTLLQDLDGHTKALRETTRRFIEMIRKPPMRMETMCFWETSPTRILNAVLPRSLRIFSRIYRIILVERDSACLLGFPEMSLDATHSMMNKYCGPEDANFKRVSHAIKSMADGAHSIVENQCQALPKEIVFLVPFPRDKNFVDRKEILDDITQQLRKFHRASLSGIGGIGKSQIAIEYAYRFQHDHTSSHIFWIYAATTASFMQAYRDFAGKLKLSGHNDPSVNQSRLFAQWLEKEDSRWLMVLDNVDDAKLFFPSSDFDKASSIIEEPHKSLIVTTRNRIIGSEFASGEPCIEVGHFSAQQAKLLLQKKLKSDDAALDQIECDQLFEILGCVPLAISQAAAFMRRNAITLSQYSTLLAKDETNLMEFLSEELQDARRQKGRPNSVYRTWKVSFNSILADTPRSAHLLSLMAMFDHQNIPERLLRGQFDSDVEFWRAIGDLAGYSLIEKEFGGKTFVLHPLVRASLQYWLEQRNQKMDYMKMSLQILAKQFPYGSFKNKDTCEALITHAQVVLNYKCTEEDDLGKRALLLHNVAQLRFEQGKYSSAYRLAFESYEIHRNLSSEAAYSTLRVQEIIAAILRAQRDFEKAKEVYQRILDQEVVLGFDHEIILNSRHGLAAISSRQGRNQEAEGALRHLIQIIEKKFSMDHPSTLASLNSLALALRRQRKYQAAEEIHRRVLNVRERTLRVEHPLTLDSLHNLAIAFQDQGQYEAAERLYRQVVSKRETILGADHPSRFDTISSLASVCYKQGRHEEAIELLKQVVEKDKEIYGADHRLTIDSAEILAEWEKKLRLHAASLANCPQRDEP